MTIKRIGQALAICLAAGGMVMFVDSYVRVSALKDVGTITLPPMAETTTRSNPRGWSLNTSTPELPQVFALTGRPISITSKSGGSLPMQVAGLWLGGHSLPPPQFQRTKGILDSTPWDDIGDASLERQAILERKR